MYFPISGVHLDPIYLVFIGFIIGVLGGFFGVGGSFSLTSSGSRLLLRGLIGFLATSI
jgi:hypothetical protein